MEYLLALGRGEEGQIGRRSRRGGEEWREGEELCWRESHVAGHESTSGHYYFAVPDKLVLSSSCLRLGGAVQLLLALNQKKMMRPLRGAAGVGLWLLTRLEGGTTDSSSSHLPSPTAGDIGPIYTSQANSVLQL
jgi:hypothetical protein